MLIPAERSKRIFRRVGYFVDLAFETVVVAPCDRQRGMPGFCGQPGIGSFESCRLVVTVRALLIPAERSKRIFRRVGCFVDLAFERVVVAPCDRQRGMPGFCW